MSYYTFKPESSSVIKILLYDIKRQCLAVQFKSNSVWVYFDVPIEVYDNFIKAPSLGNYFNLHIKNSYESSQVMTASNWTTTYGDSNG